MRVLPAGERALLVELGALSEVLGLYAELRAQRPVGVTQLVPAARTVLVGFDPAATTAEQLEATLRGLPVEQLAPRLGDLVQVPVRYDGIDLADVAQLAGMTADEVVRRHTSGEHRVAFCGFSPGFAYITGLDRRLHVPRRATPRTKVPAGAVALADEFTGVYPRESPGGWRIIGHTDLAVWDLEREPPALLRPACRVRFRVVAS